ncbi:GNAT family N-acetyltransferase [Frigidibacter sp. ROC022]|uniref:GNAT family N-acetyltransferase n=1 Tax=Frigidibacter sp. ROC022 TaxID=2971796 RepID=UPI00215A5088|nr:GNAT family N-acetyltransferase [Frigidibacter sp. ROC022]MCR8726727.1 GNAT family N-acetyltransferase [Frigidibacter sp. ROC022]
MDTQTLTLRRTTPADLAALDQLYSRSYPNLLKADYPPSTLVMALPLIARAQPRLLASGSFYLVESDGEPVGAGGWSWGGPQGGASPTHMAHVRHLVTDHRRVRQGIARRLMGHVLAEAKAAGARILDCQSTLTAVPFYASLGFREVGPILIQLRPGIEFPAVRMQKVL